MHTCVAPVQPRVRPFDLRVIVQARAAAPNDIGLYESLPLTLRQALMPFQRSSVAFVLRAGGRALLGDEMGLVRKPPPCLQPDAVSDCESATCARNLKSVLPLNWHFWGTRWGWCENHAFFHITSLPVRILHSTVPLLGDETGLMRKS